MLCNYDNTCHIDRGKRGCGKCMTGIMVLVGIIAGIVFAAITVLLFSVGLLTAVYFGMLTALITGIIILTVVLVSALFSESRSRLTLCIRKNIGGLFFGILGTILAGFLAISVNPITVTIFNLIIVGLVSFFFAFMLVSLLFIVMCVLED